MTRFLTPHPIESSSDGQIFAPNLRLS